MIYTYLLDIHVYRIFNVNNKKESNVKDETIATSRYLLIGKSLSMNPIAFY